MALFLMNAVAGRVWCGYLCPQTAWTDLFQTIERWTEGDRREHMQRNLRLRAVANGADLALAAEAVAAVPMVHRLADYCARL